jgi:hypothetical protein
MQEPHHLCLVFEYGKIQMIGKHRVYLSHMSIGKKIGKSGKFAEEIREISQYKYGHQAASLFTRSLNCCRIFCCNFRLKTHPALT